MQVRLFYVYEFIPGSTREKPIGAWVVTPDGMDYVFSPEYPQDEKLADDVLNRLVESGQPLPADFLVYWKGHVGYFRSSTDIENHEVGNYHEFLSTIAARIQ